MEGVSQPYGYQSCLFHCKKLKGESFAFYVYNFNHLRTIAGTSCESYKYVGDRVEVNLNAR